MAAAVVHFANPAVHQVHLRQAVVSYNFQSILLRTVLWRGGLTTREGEYVFWVRPEGRKEGGTYDFDQLEAHELHHATVEMRWRERNWVICEYTGELLRYIENCICVNLRGHPAWL